jgi:hypothetical protein
MNEKLLQKVLTSDPREKRKKTPEETVREWRDRRLIGLVFKWLGTLGAAYYSYWYFFEKTRKFFFARPLPLRARWSLGIAVACAFLWVVYAFFGYRCPQCQRFHRADLSFGGWLLGFRDPADSCRYCKARLV